MPEVYKGVIIPTDKNATTKCMRNLLLAKAFLRGLMESVQAFGGDVCIRIEKLSRAPSGSGRSYSVGGGGDQMTLIRLVVDQFYYAYVILDLIKFRSASRYVPT